MDIKAWVKGGRVDIKAWQKRQGWILKLGLKEAGVDIKAWVKGGRGGY